jgi:hypothetical protein
VVETYVETPAERCAPARAAVELQGKQIARGELGGFVERVMSTSVEFRFGYKHVLGGIDRATLREKRESRSFVISQAGRRKHRASRSLSVKRGTFRGSFGRRERWRRVPKFCSSFTPLFVQSEYAMNISSARAIEGAVGAGRVLRILAGV